MAFLIFSCASTTFRIEPETAPAGIVIGRVVLNSSGFSDDPFPMNSIYNKLTDVEVTFENGNGDEITVKTRNGYFFLYDALDSDYLYMTKLYYKRSRSNGMHSFKIEFDDGSRKISLKPAVVMNLGILEWTVRGGDSSSWDIQNTGHNDLKSWFRETYHESGWLDMNWKTVKLFKSPPEFQWWWSSESY